MLLTGNSLGQAFEYFQHSRNHKLPPLLQRFGDRRLFHLHQSTQSDDRQSLIVHPWKAVLRLDGREPPIKERTSHSRAVSLDKVQSCNRIVQHAVDQHFQAGQPELVALRRVKVAQSSVNYDLQVLWILSVSVPEVRTEPLTSSTCPRRFKRMESANLDPLMKSFSPRLSLFKTVV